ncbi:hypothetical protein MTO96_040474 [Rhipicephalus appendiculatus]
MMPLMLEYIDGLLESLEESARSGSEVNMVHTYEQLAMHMVAHVSFGVDCRVRGSPGHSITAVVRYVCHKIMTGPLHMIAQYDENGALRRVAKQTNGRVKTRPLTTLEVTNCATTIFVAGNETIASALSYLTFVLAKYPDAQEKGQLDFETVGKRLDYLEQVIKETLRLYPPGLTYGCH